MTYGDFLQLHFDLSSQDKFYHDFSRFSDLCYKLVSEFSGFSSATPTSKIVSDSLGFSPATPTSAIFCQSFVL